MEKQESLPLGVVMEKRTVDHPWKDFDWRPVAVIPGAPPRDPAGAWTELKSGEGWTHYHSGTLPLRLFRGETEGYKVNLSQQPPRIFVVVRPDEDGETEHEFVPFLVTVCPYEAQDYLDSSEEMVEVVTMPPAIVAFVESFIEQHHVDEVFVKRKRKRHDTEGTGFGRPGGLRGRMRGDSG